MNSPYQDTFDDHNYLEAVLAEETNNDNVMLKLSVNSAQLYQHKASDCWIYNWLVMDLEPSERYKKEKIFPGGFILGPGKPKNLHLFLFPGLFHPAAIQSLQVWNALAEVFILSNLYIILRTTNGPGMA